MTEFYDFTLHAQIDAIKTIRAELSKRGEYDACDHLEAAIAQLELSNCVIYEDYEERPECNFMVGGL